MDNNNCDYINDLAWHWNEWGKIDPMWSVIALPEKEGNKWELEEFMETGVCEVKEFLEYVNSLGIKLKFQKVLDFGCAVGRLTQAFAPYFKKVVGVDISDSMVDFAKKVNKYQNNCGYCVNKSCELKMFDDEEFELIYTNNVLQHIDPEYSTKYIKEFIRLVSPHGLVVFQQSKRVGSPAPTSEWLQKNRIRVRQAEEPFMEMHSMEQGEVVDFVERNGGKVINTRRVHINDDPTWRYFQYFVSK